MVDLNEWLLEYVTADGFVEFTFGTHESGFPFTKQVAVGVVTRETSDRPNPTGNGVVPGVDRARGRILGFAGAHLDQSVRPDDTAEWTHPMDLGGDVEAVWQADDLVGVDGAVASLTNVDRGRVVYGRPRNYALNLDKVRHGWSEWSGEFHTVDPLFYDVEEQAVTVSTAAGVTGGVAFPVTFPVTTTAGTEARGWITAGGNRPTWPVVVVAGPCTDPTVSLLNAGGGVRWSVTMLTTLGAGQVAYLDTRPWSREVSVSSGPADGLARGSQLADCRIPVGLSEVRLSVAADPSGMASVLVTWRDAHSSL